MDEKLRPTYDAFADAWRLYRRFAHLAYGRLGMEAFVRRAKEYVWDHGGTPLAADLANAVERSLITKSLDRFAANLGSLEFVDAMEVELGLEDEISQQEADGNCDGGATEEELRPIYATFQGAWKLYRAFSGATDAKDAEEYRERLESAAQEYAKAHGGTPLAVDLASAVKKALEASHHIRQRKPQEGMAGTAYQMSDEEYNALEWEAVDGMELAKAIVGLEVVGADPIDHPETDGMSIFFRDKEGGITVLVIESEPDDFFDDELEPQKAKSKYCRWPIRARIAKAGKPQGE